jgi:hypothetical protein
MSYVSCSTIFKVRYWKQHRLNVQGVFLKIKTSELVMESGRDKADKHYDNVEKYYSG